MYDEQAGAKGAGHEVSFARAVSYTSSITYLLQL